MLQIGPFWQRKTARQLNAENMRSIKQYANEVFIPKFMSNQYAKSPILLAMLAEPPRA
jgi:hypothetical protein